MALIAIKRSGAKLPGTEYFKGRPYWPFTVNRESLQAKGLTHWWPFNHPYGNRLYELSGHGHHGTLNFGPAWQQDEFAGPVLHFDGTDDNVSLPRSYDFQVMTIAGWFKRDVIDADHSIITNTIGALRYGFGFDVRSTNFLRFVAVEFNGALNFDVQGTTSIAANRWYHAAVVLEGPNVGNDVILYLDGVEEGRDDQEKTLDYSGALLPKIGQWGVTQLQNRMEGSIADVRIYDRPMGPSEIRHLYAPATRWDLYQPLAPRDFLYLIQPAAGVISTGDRVRVLTGGIAF